MNIRTRLIASAKIWAAIYPLLTIALYVFGHPLSSLPLMLRTLILTAVLVPMVVFVGLPAVEWVLKTTMETTSRVR
jgi:antibiotic biosynthesis monooxygenase (ABM) superfamily enzyme